MSAFANSGHAATWVRGCNGPSLCENFTRYKRTLNFEACGRAQSKKAGPGAVVQGPGPRAWAAIGSLNGTSGGSMMRRREFIALIGGATAWPVAPRAQEAAGKRRIGVLMGWDENDPLAKAGLDGFAKGLRELGWNDRNLQTELRWAAGNVDRMRMLASCPSRSRRRPCASAVAACTTCGGRCRRPIWRSCASSTGYI